MVSPDGKLVLGRRAAGGPGRLYTVRSHGGGLHPLTSGPAEDHDPDFSADGKSIAFVRTVGANDDIFWVRPSGARLARLTKTGGHRRVRAALLRRRHPLQPR